MKLERLESNYGGQRSRSQSLTTHSKKNFVPGPNEPDIRRRRLLKEINNDLSDRNKSVRGVGKKIEQLKSFERVL